tara:strand:+ start:501 stop:716 length:216 start_codon:yes stop_codon:yes gene_type:complete
MTRNDLRNCKSLQNILLSFVLKKAENWEDRMNGIHEANSVSSHMTKESYTKDVVCEYAKKWKARFLKELCL